MKSSASLIYAGIGLLVLGLISLFGGSIYGRAEQEQRFIVDLFFYIGVVLGAIGFICLVIAIYSRFKQRENFGEDDL